MIKISKELLKFYNLTEDDFLSWCSQNNIKYYAATIKDKARFFNEKGQVRKEKDV